jgi:hypothetical protein
MLSYRRFNMCRNIGGYMEEKLKSKIEELKDESKKHLKELQSINDRSKIYGLDYYYEELAEVFAKLNKCQFALDVLTELEE